MSSSFVSLDIKASFFHVGDYPSLVAKKDNYIKRAFIKKNLCGVWELLQQPIIYIYFLTVAHYDFVQL